MNGTDGAATPASSGTIKVTKRTDRSDVMFILQHLMKPFGPKITTPKKIMPAGSPKLDPHKKAKKQCNIDERRVEDIYIYDLTAKRKATGYNGVEQTKDKKRKRLYYFAGGGWQMPASSEHWWLCAEMAVKLPDTAISIVSYPLAPNSPAPSAFPQLMKLYRRLLEDAEEAGEQVILAGDSAGGNVILCLALAGLAEDENAPCPNALMAISPSTDLRRQNPDIRAIEKHDPLLRLPFVINTANKWRADWDAVDPRVSPLMTAMDPLARRGVKVHGVVGRYDILSPDAVLFRDKCDEAGVEGEWLDWEKQMHCFPLAWTYGLRESKEAKDWVLDVLRKT